ncbi:hypothetical protein [Solibacillus sp. FSL H8-0538]|uniref:hypothetical protein n=1 Tax=Solibacillus sp. FSL H8-0538 TaxID=2921400 RepID=UPI0030F7853C
MNEKIVSTVLVVGASLTALFFVVKQNFELAVFALTIMFALSNFFRFRSFKEKGYEKEAKWMKYMSLFFAVASAFVLYIIISG